MNIIVLILIPIMLYDILKILSAYITNKTKKTNDFGKIIFKESTKYYIKLFHFVGLLIFFVLSSFSSNLIYDNLPFSLIALSILSIFWLYVYLSKRLIITENGIGYMGILNSIADFVYYEDIEFLHIEKLKVVSYLNSKEKRKYSINLSNEELIEAQSYIPSDIKQYVYKI